MKMQSGPKNNPNKTLRIGFDLDGVLLYNPARIVRPLISLYKKTILHKRKLSFYYPKTPFEKSLWKLFHKSSIFIAPGVDDIRSLVREKKIKAYIITARFGYMGNELEEWVKKHKFGTFFTGIYYNKKDEQPHLFKERMIQKLALDYFIEDNYDIVTYLTKNKLKTKIFWIYNIGDFFQKHSYKFPTLKKAVSFFL